MKINIKLLKLKMIEKNLSCMELAKISDVSWGTIYNTINEKHNPGIKTISKIIKALEINISDIIE